MSHQSDQLPTETIFRNRLVCGIALLFILLGVLNCRPPIPGLDDFWRNLTGIPGLKMRNFATEWFYPIIFFIMMCIVALRDSIWRAWYGTARSRFGLFRDVASIAATAAISLTT